MVGKYIYIILFFILLSDNYIWAQSPMPGVPLISNYPSTLYKSNDQNWAVGQAFDGKMLFGNNEGLLMYDGNSWDNVILPGQSVIRSVATDSLGNIYIGAVKDFGVFHPAKDGSLKYISYTSQLDSLYSCTTDVWKTYTNGKDVYFCTIRFIYVFSNDKLVKIHKLHGESSFFSFLVNKSIYIGDFNRGLLTIGNDSLLQVKNGGFFIGKNIFSVLDLSSTELMIATYQDGVYNYNLETGQISNFFKSANELKDGLIYSAIKTNNNNFVFGSLANGIYIYNENRELLYNLNKENGLLGNTITSLFESYNGNVWLTLDNGISQVIMPTYITHLNEKNGLSGIIYKIQRFNNHLLVGTSTGLYSLNEKNYNEGFKELGGIGNQVWDIEIADFENGQKFALIGSNTGLYILDKQFNLQNYYEFLPAKVRLEEEAKLFSIRTLIQNPYNKEQIFVGTSTGLAIFQYKNSNWSKIDEISLSMDIRHLYFENQNDIWISTFLRGIHKFSFQSSDSISYTIKSYGLEKGLPSLKDLSMANFNDTLVFGRNFKGFYYYDKSLDSMLKWTTLPGIETFEPDKFYSDVKGDLWVSINNDEKSFDLAKIGISGGKTYIDSLISLKLLSGTSLDGIYSDDQFTIFGIGSELYFYDQNLITQHLKPYNTLINKVVAGADSTIFKGYYYKYINDSITGFSLSQPDILKSKLVYKLNDIILHVSSPWFMNSDELKYSYFLKGDDQGWSQWTSETKYIKTNLREGKYTFFVKARNVFGIESKIQQYEFSILPPWYRTIVAYLFYILVFIFVLWSTVKWYTRRLVKEKEHLEEIVAERTREINEQKEKIEDQNKEIKDSIRYAQRIQKAILPSNEKAAKLLRDNYFILFKPRDIVSGDFYWMGEQENRVIVIAADCTGHGVPGAFMSMLGVSFLNEIVSKEVISHANIILNELRESVKLTLGQTGKENEAKDGMDVALTIIDYDKMELQYSGAYNPILLFRDGEVIEYKADKNPIGIHFREIDSFTNHVIELKKGDTFYIFSDGYTDQFGGEEGRKFMMKPFKRLLQEIQNKSMSEQLSVLEGTMNQWIGQSFEQIDDILVIGIRI